MSKIDFSKVYNKDMEYDPNLVGVMTTLEEVRMSDEEFRQHCLNKLK